MTPSTKLPHFQSLDNYDEFSMHQDLLFSDSLKVGFCPRILLHQSNLCANKSRPILYYYVKKCLNQIWLIMQEDNALPRWKVKSTHVDVYNGLLSAALFSITCLQCTWDYQYHVLLQSFIFRIWRTWGNSCTQLLNILNCLTPMTPQNRCK